MDDLFMRLSYAKLKSPKKGELRDGLEHRRYLGGSVFGARGSFCNGSGVMKAFRCLDICHHIL